MVKIKKDLIAVTGASGHIGANLIRILKEKNKKVRVLDYYDSNAYEGLDIEIIKGNILDKQIVSDFIEGSEYVYHLAGKIYIGQGRDQETENVNILGTRNVAQACLKHGVKRLIHFSSIHALWPHPRKAIVDENRSITTSLKSHCYDRSKAISEQEVNEAIKKGLDAVILIPCGVIGPNDFMPSAMGRMLLEMKNKDVFYLCEGGFHWVDARDVALASIESAEKGRAGERYIISGEWLSLRHIGEIVDEFYSKKTKFITLPSWVAMPVAYCIEALGRWANKSPLFTPAAVTALQNYKKISLEKAKKELGFKPRPVRQAVIDTLAWYEEMGRKK